MLPALGAVRRGTLADGVFLLWTPASLLNINSNSNSNSGGFNSNSNSNSGVGVEPNSNSNSGVDPNPDWNGSQGPGNLTQPWLNLAKDKAGNKNPRGQTLEKRLYPMIQCYTPSIKSHVLLVTDTLLDPFDKSLMWYSKSRVARLPWAYCIRGLH